MSSRSLLTITLAELEKHSDSKSCYVTIGSKVYDVTTFLQDHPGGEDLVLEYAGKDVSKIMTDEISHTHSEAAYEILDDCLVGLLPENHIPAQVGGNLPPTPPRTPNNLTTTGMDSEAELSVSTDIVNDFKVHRFLDLNRPLFLQIWNGGFSKEFYLQQIHKPRHYKGGESAPLFGNCLEPLSKTAWWVVPTVWLPWVIYGTYEGFKGLGSATVTAAFFVLGLFFWTLTGLIWAILLNRKMPDNRVFITMHFIFHGIHHYLPMDRYRLVMPPVLFTILAIPFWKAIHIIFWNWYMGTTLFCGGILGYICYDLTHYFLHHKTLPSYYMGLKKYHLQHHFADYQKGFGVTSKFWDKVFGTELYYGPGINNRDNLRVEKSE